MSPVILSSNAGSATWLWTHDFKALHFGSFIWKIREKSDLRDCVWWLNDVIHVRLLTLSTPSSRSLLSSAKRTATHVPFRGSADQQQKDSQGWVFLEFSTPTRCPLSLVTRTTCDSQATSCSWANCCDLKANGLWLGLGRGMHVLNFKTCEGGNETLEMPGKKSLWSSCLRAQSV